MNRIWLVLRKDALVLRRSPLLFGILIAYPVAIALLVGLVAGYASSKPRVALVDEDNLPDLWPKVVLLRISPDDPTAKTQAGIFATDWISESIVAR